MENIFYDANPLVVFVAAIVAYLFGGLWFSPWGIGRLWKNLKTEQEKAAYAADKKKKDAHLWSFVMMLVTSYAITVLINGLGIDGMGQGLMVGVMCWAGFMAPAAVNGVLWEKVSARTAAVNAGYQLCAALIMAAISTIWY